MGVKFAGKGKPNPYAEHLQAVPMQGHTTVISSKKVNGIKEEKLVSDKSEVVHKGVVYKADQLCQMEVGGGVTIQTAPFEFARIDVHLRVPCSKDDLSESYEFASDWVSSKLQVAVADAKGE